MKRCAVQSGRQVKSTMFASLLAATLIVHGCGANQSSTSDLSHNADEPIRDTAAFNWTEVSDAEYREYMSPLLGLENNFLPASNAVTQRTQFWIDQFDRNLRQRYPDVMAAAPRPQARVIINPSVNAFVAPVPVCVTLRGSWANASGSGEAAVAFLDVSTGSFSEWPSEQYRCRAETDEAQSRALLAGFVRSFNANSRSACKLEMRRVAGREELRSNAACDVGGDLDGIASTRSIAFMRTGDWINVYTGIIPEMGEAEFAGVVAHELGHYYRAHITAPDDFFGYFYRLSERNPSTRPERDSSLDSLGARVLQASAVVQTSGVFKTVAGQRFSSKVYLALGSLGATVCATGDCSDACQTFSTLVGDRTYVSDTNFFPFRELSARGRTRYAEFETAASACLATIPVGSAAGSRTWEQLATLIAMPVWPAWLTSSEDIKSTVLDLGRTTIGLLPNTAPAGVRDASAGYLAMSRSITAAEADSDVALREAFEQRLGHFTFEQEADELSGEWLPQIGLDPKSAVEVHLSFGRWAAQRGADAGMPFDVGIEECDRLYQHGWRESDGSYRYIAIGDYNDPHHSFCYRAFNLDRDIRAHGFRVAAGVRPPTPQGGTWAEIQTLASRASAEFGDDPARPTDQRPAGITRFWKNQCPMAPAKLR